MNTPKLPDPPILEGRIKKVDADACLVEVGEFGIGRLRKVDSLARDLRPPLSELPQYRPGEKVRVYLDRHREREDEHHWWFNERWGHDNPWAELDLEVGQEVRGTVVGRGKSGHAIQLDAPDIRVWLPDGETPWKDGTTGEPVEGGTERLKLWVGDRLKLEIKEIHYPPLRPIVSLNAFLFRQEAVLPEPAHADASAAGKLGHRLHIATDELAALNRRRAEEPPLAGRRLLVVDDDPKALEGLARMLEAFGAQVEPLPVGSSLGEALGRARALLDGGPFDAALVDYCLPSRGEGLTLACRLRRHQPGLRIALFSGVPLQASDLERMEGCIDRLLSRPVTLDAVTGLLSGAPADTLDNGSSQRLLADATPAMPHTPAQVLASYQGSGLAFLVLLHAAGPHHLEGLHRVGRFPTDPAELEPLLTTTDLGPLLAGAIGDFSVAADDEEGRNRPLWPFARRLRFFALDARGGRPRHLLGLGWNGQSPPCARRRCSSCASGWPSPWSGGASRSRSIPSSPCSPRASCCSVSVTRSAAASAPGSTTSRRWEPSGGATVRPRGRCSAPWPARSTR